MPFLVVDKYKGVEVFLTIAAIAYILLPWPANSHECTLPEDYRKSAIGRVVAPDLEEEILRISHASLLRILRPGLPYLPNTRSNRVNIQVDRQGRITDIRCDPSAREAPSLK
jgi:hypothetical protein